MFDADDCLKWAKTLETLTINPNDPTDPEVKRQPVIIRVFGKELKHNLPLLTLTPSHIETLNPDDITKDFYEYIIKYAKRRMLSDTILGIRQQLMKTHKLFLYKNIPVWYPIPNLQEIVQPADTPEHMSAQAAIIMMKEQLDGYYMLTDYKLQMSSPDPTKKNEEVDFPLKHDYNLSHPIT